MAQVKITESDMIRILTALPDAYYRTDMQGNIQFYSGASESIFGFRPREIIGKKITSLYWNPEEREQFLEALEKNNGIVSSFETKMRHKTGKTLWLSTSAWYMKDDAGNVVGIEGVSREVTHSKALEDVLRETTESYRKLYEEHLNILEHSPGGILKIDSDMKISYMNTAMKEILGVPPGEAASTIGLNIMTIPSVQKAGFIPVLNKIAAMEKVVLEAPFVSLYGKKSYMSLNAVPFEKNNEFQGAVILITDISKMKEMSDSLRVQATHDSLTGLYNRREFENKLAEAIESSRNKKNSHALCYVDLDQFKVVNDTCGHIAGDELLRQLAPLLEKAVGEGNFVARLGGDEFGIIYYEKSLQEGEKKAKDLLSVIQDFRFYYASKSFEIGASIGLVEITPDSGSIGDLLSAADSACYLAKETGRNRIQIYKTTDEALQSQKNHMQWFQKLNQAIEKDRFILYFQPIKMAGSNLTSNVVGEFLVRMVSEDGQIIPPALFIPSAERYQLMHKIDKFVIDSVFSLLALKYTYSERKKHKKSDLDKVFTINLSAQSISTPGFREYVEEKLKEYHIPAGSICFEITETAVISNVSEAIKFIVKLKDAGCMFALDDFGSGMSSLTYLKRLPVDFVKIDGSFVMSMKNNPADMVMIKSVVEISRSMNLRTIAEFVEDGDTEQTLIAIGIDYTQGYHHGKPLDAKDNHHI